MVVTEVGTGYISAMVGGRNTEGSQLFNRAISPRQPGSSIKPLSVYGAALQKSYELAKSGKTYTYVDYGFDDQGVEGWGDYITAKSTVIDEPLTVNGEEWPQNFSRTFTGYNTFRTALQQSINTCAVKILWQVGPDYSMEMLEKYGLSTLVTDESLATNDVNPAALALGAMTYGVSPLEMSLAYSVFPSGGYLNTPVCYVRVLDSKDKELLKSKSERTKVLDEGVAWIMTDLLKSVVSDGIAGNARISGIEVGGKTGTTNDLFDVWFDGFTPDYSAALWIGTDLNVEMVGGSYQAARLWGKIMGKIPGVRDGEYLEMPANVVKEKGEYFTKGTEKNPGGSYGKSSDKKKKKKKTEEPEELVEALPQDNGATSTPSAGSSQSGSGSSSEGGTVTPDTGGGSTGGTTGGGTTGSETGGTTGSETGGN